MMKTLTSFIFVLITLSSFSQNFSQYENVYLTNAAEHRRAEPQVILACDLVLSTPIEKKNNNRSNAISFIAKWMSGTADYSFAIDETLKKITARDMDLIGVYYACISKYAIEQGKGTEREELKLQAYKMFATYCDNPDNNYKPRGEMKKMVDAQKQGKLQEYLDTKK